MYSDRILLKWSYNINSIESLLQQQQHSSQYKIISNNNVNKKQIIDTIYFELYLNKTNINDEAVATSTQIQSKNNQQLLIQPYIPLYSTSYRTIQGSKFLISPPNNQQIKTLQYEYNLTNLASNTQYIFYLSARLDSLESSLTGPLIIQTPSMFKNLFFIFILFIFLILLLF